MRWGILWLLAGCAGGEANDVTIHPAHDLAGGSDLAAIANDLSASDLSASDRTPAGYVVETLSGVVDPIQGIWGAHSGDVYLLDTWGNIFHTSGDGVWVQQHSDVGEFAAIWGSGADDIWAGGAVFPCGGACKPRLLHSGGDGAWSEVSVPGGAPDKLVKITSIAGTGKNDVYAAMYGPSGNQGVLHSSNGQTFSLQSMDQTGAPFGVFAAGAQQLYLVRLTEELLRSTGNGSWPLEASTGDQMTAVSGTSASDLWAVGYQSQTSVTMYHSTGNGVWSPQKQATDFGVPHSIAAVSPSDIYVGCGLALLHSAGDGVWTPEVLPQGGDHEQVAAFADGQVYVSAGGVLLHKR